MSTTSLSLSSGKSFWRFYAKGARLSTLIVTFTQWNGMIQAYRQKGHFNLDTFMKCYARIGFVFFFWPLYLISYTQDYVMREKLNEKHNYSRGDKLYVYDSYFQTAMVVAEEKRPLP